MGSARRRNEVRITTSGWLIALNPIRHSRASHSCPGQTVQLRAGTSTARGAGPEKWRGTPVDEADAPVCVEERGRSGERAGGEHVVGVELDDELRLHESHAQVDRRDVAQVALVSQNRDARVGGQLGGEVRGLIGRAVIDDDQPNVHVSLLENAPRAPAEVAGIVVAGDDCGDRRAPVRARRHAANHALARRVRRGPTHARAPRGLRAAPPLARSRALSRDRGWPRPAARARQRSSAAGRSRRAALILGRPGITTAAGGRRRRRGPGARSHASSGRG